MTNRIRLGMFLIGGNGWRGGLNYQRTLLQILAGPLADVAEARLFVSADQKALADEAFDGLLPVQPIVDDRAAGAGIGRRALSAMIFGADSDAAALLAEHRIDVAFENARFFGPSFQIPTISWIPDFQHRALPHLFTKFGWWKREIGFRAQTSSRRVVMLSSKSAQAECEKYYPRSRGRTTVVRFAPTVDTAEILSESGKARKAHGLPAQFFYMPNQFWAHKNHSVVLEALRTIQDWNQLKVMPPVVMSGPVEDKRSGCTYDDVMARAESFGLSPWFKHLGLIPMQDVLALNSSAIAVLNPSLFEGWASTVEEAKALGSPMILSDIAVHREQAPNARFFHPNDARGLARALLEAAKSPPARIESFATLAEQTKQRRQAFIKAFAATLEQANALQRA